MNKYKTLMSNTMLISIGTIGSKLITFLMVRFYTGCMAPSEYSTADLIIQTANLLLPLISFGITDSVFRFALVHNKIRKSIFTYGFLTITVGATLFILLIPLFMQVKEFREYIWLIVIFTMSSCYHSLCSQFVRAKGETGLYAAQGLLNTVMVVGFNITFLAVFNMGITGYVLSVAMADVICTAFLIIKDHLWKEITFNIRKQVLLHMLKYSIPLIPTTVFWWITSVSDRYMINGFIGSDANGIYTVAYKIPTILTIVAGIFLEAWQFSAIQESKGGQLEHMKFYEKIWNIFQAAMFIACGVLIALSKLEISLLSDKGYYEAWRYVPLLCLAMLFSTFVSFMGSIYAVKQRSELSFRTSMFGAALNIGLNFLLIPSSMGIYGAALSTAVSYFTVFIVRTLSTRSLLPFKLHRKRTLLGCLILAVQTGLMMAEGEHWIAGQIICMLLLIFCNLEPLYDVVSRILSFLKKRKTDKRG